MPGSNTLHPPLLTIADISARFQVSTKTVRRWINSGDLIAHQLGVQWRISDADFELFLRDRRGANLRGNGGQ